MSQIIDNSKDYEKELARIYDCFNEHFWNNELPEVIITFVPTRKAHGHMTSNPVWYSDNDNPKYELNISAYTISRPPSKICETLLHEQCHLYCNIKMIKDTSNQGRYHNKRFKAVAEEHGLTAEYTKITGWSETSLNTESLNYIKKLKIKKFAYQRDYIHKGSNLKRFSCPHCNKPSVYSVTPQNILCGTCFIPLMYMPRKVSSKG